MKPTREEVLKLALKLEAKPILYTDVINDVQMCRDDLWLLTTEQLINLCSDHVAVTSAEPESSLTDGIDLFALFEAGWSFHQSLQGHVLDGRDVGRLTGCEFWPAILQRMHIGTDLHVGLSVDEAIVRLKQEIKRRLTVAQQWQKHDQCLAAQSGISSPSHQPNEKDVAGEGK